MWLREKHRGGGAPPGAALWRAQLPRPRPSKAHAAHLWRSSVAGAVAEGVAWRQRGVLRVRAWVEGNVSEKDEGERE